MEKIMFINTYRDYHANGTNRSYWSKFFKVVERLLQEKNKMRMYSSFNENMPIFEYYSEARNRFVRVMQYDPHGEMVESEKYPAKRYYTAWIDERVIEEKEMVTLPELVVCLLMTETNVKKAEELIRSWLFGKDETTREMIEKIYQEQEKMDEEIL